MRMDDVTGGASGAGGNTVSPATGSGGFFYDSSVATMGITPGMTYGVGQLVNINTSTAPQAVGQASLLLQGTANKERIEIRSFGAGTPGFQGAQAGGTVANPTVTQTGSFLIFFGGGGYDGATFTGNKAMIAFKAQGTYASNANGTFMTFETTSAADTAKTRTERMRITDTGSVYIGGGAALAVSATDGFFYPPSCAGVPTGAATAVTGAAPSLYDSTNHIPWWFDGTNWGSTYRANSKSALVSTTYQVLSTDDFILCTGSSNFTITLPAVAGAKNRQITITRDGVAGNTVTVAGSGAELINGANTYTGLTGPFSSVTVQCNGTQWYVIAKI